MMEFPKLTRIEHTVMSLRHAEYNSYKDVAKAINRSIARVHQVERKAMRKIMKPYFAENPPVKMPPPERGQHRY